MLIVYSMYHHCLIPGSVEMKHSWRLCVIEIDAVGHLDLQVVIILLEFNLDHLIRLEMFVYAEESEIGWKIHLLK